MPQPGALFQSHPEKVMNLLGEIESGRLAVPDFQRSFIWPARNTARLLGSIMARYPAGAILTWRPGQHALGHRAVEGAPTVEQIGLPERLILDGQQRLTSLYRALHASGESRFTVALENFIDRDTFAARDVEAIDWETAVVAHEPNAKQRRAKANGELPLYETEDWQIENWQFPIDHLAEPSGFDKWMAKLVKALPAGMDKELCQERMWQVRDSYLVQLQQYEFPVITLLPTAGLSAVCRIFETLNTNAVKLGAFAILTARFYPDGIDLRARWKEAKKKHALLRDPGEDKDVYGYAVDPYTVLQIISARRHGSPQQKVVTSDLTADDVKADWEAAVDALAAVINHLRGDCGVIHRDLLPYSMLLVPLTVGWLEREGLAGPEKAAALRKLERYFWASSFTTNFDQGGASQAEKDCRELAGWIRSESRDGEPVMPEAVGKLTISAQTLLTATVRKKALLRATMALGASAGSKDFHTGERLQASTYVQRKYDSHHLVPKKCLSGSGPTIDPGGHSSELILNRALIDSSTNRRIGAKKPSTYVAEIFDEDVDAGAILASHLIDVDALRADDFDVFIRSRLSLLIDAIESATEKTVTPLPADAAVSGVDADSDADDDGL
ncbi:MAG TPA: DUF262 domain-containing protein [Solirubrobacteraceae bacterium]|nr:DUF262 domain-containing protein [Solirubrobacteraceae bacterium]